MRLMSKTRLAKLASITVDCEPETARIEGNASAIDPQTDREIVDMIRTQLADGNQWAWCTVTVRATYGHLSASEVIGCCSYPSEKAFRRDAYYRDLRDRALADLLLLVHEYEQASEVSP